MSAHISAAKTRNRESPLEFCLLDECGKPNYALSIQDLGEREFPLDVCRNMIALMDPRHCGKLHFLAFRALWSMMDHWKVSIMIIVLKRNG